MPKHALIQVLEVQVAFAGLKLCERCTSSQKKPVTYGMRSKYLPFASFSVVCLALA